MEQDELVLEQPTEDFDMATRGGVLRDVMNARTTERQRLLVHRR